MELSIVIPVFNEADSIPDLVARIDAAIQTIEWQCIWVNDGSTDATLTVLKEIHDKNQHHEVIDLKQNYGQSAALAVGFRYAQGRYIGTLDGDGQNDPQDLVRMVEILNQQEYDVVNGYRQKRHDSLIRRISSKIANTIRRVMTNEYEVVDIGCSTRAFRKECVDEIPLFKGMHRFLPTLIKMKGFKMYQIPVSHMPRMKGITKYTINNRLWVGVMDLFAVWWMRRRLVYPKVKVATLPERK